MALNLRPLRFEQLEDKRLLAGDVTVSVVEGALVITGDEEGNQIAVSSGDEAGEFVIQGLDGTLLHLAGEEGEGSSELTVTGVRYGLHFAMGDGDDSVAITNARIRGNVVIHTGQGDDDVAIGITEAVPAETLAAAVAEGGVAIAGSLIIRTGEGDDTVALGGQVEEETPELVEEEPEATPALRVGHTLVAGLGGGDDSFSADSVLARFATVVEGGTGADTIDLARARTKVLTLLGGGGDFADTIGLSDVYASIATLGAGAGNDTVEILDSAFGVLTVRTGNGDDTVSIGNTKARLAVLLGGEGSADTYNDLGGNEFGRLVVRGFEIPEELPETPLTVAEPARTILGQVLTAGQSLLGRLADRLRGR